MRLVFNDPFLHFSILWIDYPRKDYAGLPIADRFKALKGAKSIAGVKGLLKR